MHHRSTVPSFVAYKRVFLSLSPHTCTLCPIFSLDPSVVGLVPPCTVVTNFALTCGNMQNEACVASISQSGLSHPASYGNDGSNVGMFVQSGAVTLGTPIILTR